MSLFRDQSIGLFDWEILDGPKIVWCKLYDHYLMIVELMIIWPKDQSIDFGLFDREILDGSDPEIVRFKPYDLYSMNRELMIVRFES